MRLLDNYIAKTVAAAIGLVTLMLAGLQIFILFVNQLDDLGKMDFGLWQAAVFVFLQMPYQVYLFFPMASLLGCLIGLGVLANHSELVVMRAAGMSIGQITLAVLKAALILIFLVTAFGELVIPKLASYANEYKMAAVSGGQALRTASGLWLRSGNDFIMIGQVLPDDRLQQVSQFQFDSQHHLVLARQIGEVRFEGNHWQAYQVSQTLISAEKTVPEQIQTMPWPVNIQPRILRISGSDPDEMTLTQLRRYIHEQKLTHQYVVDYKLAFWQRLIQPLTTAVMMMLAIPFIFGPLRSSTMGSKLVAGATVGFGFYLINRFFGPVSMVYQLPPEIAALGPTLIFALLGWYLMRRVR